MEIGECMIDRIVERQQPTLVHMARAEECTQYGTRSGPKAVGVITLAYLNAESMVNTRRELQGVDEGADFLVHPAMCVFSIFSVYCLIP